MLRNFGSDEKDLKLYMCARSASSEKGQQAFKIRPVNLKSLSPRANTAGMEHSDFAKPQHL